MKDYFNENNDGNQTSNNIIHYADDSNQMANPSYDLPFVPPPIAKPPISNISKQIFNCVELAKDDILNPRTLPSHSQIENNKELRLTGCDPILISENIDYSNIFNTNLSDSLITYAFMQEINSKVTFYLMNNFPFIVSTSDVLQSLIMRAVQSFSLYDFLNHTLFSLAYSTLYHKSRNNSKDQVLGYKPEVYLSLANYHYQRGFKSLSIEVKMSETARRTTALQISIILQIIYSVLSPSQKMCSNTFLMNYENLNYIDKKFGSSSSKCKIFKEATMSFNAMDCDINDSSIYFPEYLYQLCETSYGADHNDQGLNDSQKLAIMETTHWLKRLFKLPNTQVNKDFAITIKRLFENVHDEFINLVSQNEPRSMILIGYSIMLLASKPNRIVGSKSFFLDEIDFIFNKLDNIEHGDKWKKWLDPVVSAINTDYER